MGTNVKQLAIDLKYQVESRRAESAALLREAQVIENTRMALESAIRKDES